MVEKACLLHFGGGFRCVNESASSDMAGRLADANRDKGMRGNSIMVDYIIRYRIRKDDNNMSWDSCQL